MRSIKYTCVFCDRVFPNLSGLEVHMVIHTREKPFFCKQCDACFGYQGSLNDHELSHQGVRYRCKKCKKIFNVRTTFACHRKFCYGDNTATWQAPIILQTQKKINTNTSNEPEIVEVDEDMVTEELIPFDTSPVAELPRVPDLSERPQVKMVCLPFDDERTIAMTRICPPRFRTIHELPEHPRNLFFQVGDEIPLMPVLSIEDIRLFHQRVAANARERVAREQAQANPPARKVKLEPKYRAPKRIPRRRRPGKIFKCSLCSAMLSSQGNLRRHIRLSHKELADSGAVKVEIKVEVQE